MIYKAKITTIALDSMEDFSGKSAVTIPVPNGSHLPYKDCNS